MLARLANLIIDIDMMDYILLKMYGTIILI